jgi:hypothetical protein
MNGFHLRWSHANSIPAWSASEVGRLLSSCAIPIPADRQQKRHGTRVERRIDLIKDQHLLERSATSMLTTMQLITAANTQVNLLTDHVSQPGSSPTDRFIGGPLTTPAHTPGYTMSPLGTQIRGETSHGTHDLHHRAHADAAIAIQHLPTHGQREVNPVHDDDYPYWGRAADIAHYTACDIHNTQSCHRDTEQHRSSLPATHIVAPQADRHRHTTIMQWRWHMTCEDGEQLTAMQFADDLLVSHAHRPDTLHLSAVLRTTAIAH